MAIAKTKAQAYPTKEFFVRMITRDISLEDCILDLIDNSVDGAWRTEGSRPIGLATDADLSKYKIDISATAKHFCIEDNCGGMTLDDAVEHAFSFGRKSDDEPEDYSIGVYGIGMKRAVFKLGTVIKVRSTYTSQAGALESFVVPINVDAWLANEAPAWDFDIEPDEPLSAPGVKIEVEGLTSGASTAFDSPAFVRNLKRTIARDYSLHINRGLTISLNGEPITGWQIKMLQSAEFAPMRIEYSDKIDGKDVSIEVFGGMSAPPPESNEPEEGEEDEKFFGWYVVCNGRIVLAADRTNISGWGTDEWPQWHPQYAGFIGIVIFTAADAAALPLTTTKRSVDVSSEVYRRARPRMREVTRKWIGYTNARKSALDDAKQIEAKAQPVSIYAVQRAQTVRLPSLAARASEQMATVNYSVPLQKFKQLAKELGSITMSRRELGLKTFNYAYDDFVGE
jgi:hypothetical protein